MKVLCLFVVACHIACQLSDAFVVRSNLAGRRSSGAFNVIPKSGSDDVNIKEVKVIVRGNSIHGPFYRTMVKQEATMMRRLVGSFTESEDGVTTEITVQGKGSSVESFVRFLQNGYKKVDMKDPVEVVSVEFTDSEQIREISGENKKFDKFDMSGVILGLSREGMGGVYM